MLALSVKRIDEALGLMGERLEADGIGPYRIVVCGGAGLIVCSMVTRQTTQDVDIVALMDETNCLVSPDPLPDGLLRAARDTARDLGLPERWLNNGPSREPGGLFQAELPKGLTERLTCRDYGPRLRVHFVGRLDQIHFKVFACVDQGPGRHLEDLRQLEPTAEEMEMAARWAMTHDPSEGFRQVLISMLEQTGYGKVAESL